MKTKLATRKQFRLCSISQSASNGWLKLAHRRFACQLGNAGQTARKREGDGATPRGRWPVIRIYYRADRIARPRTALPVKIITRNDGWCDDPLDRNYNRPVQLPYPASAEHLWRDDHAYDLVVVLDYNFSRRSKHKGSAIFLHLAHDDMRPTAGCLAFSERDLRMLLQRMGRGDVVVV